MALVDSVAEQELLEGILEEFKPPLPEEAKSLHYLLAAPFRYMSRWPSRFRTANDPGVWYGASELRTACAEVGYWRWRFVRDSDAFDEGLVRTEHTFYPADLDGPVADLTSSPWSMWQADWMRPDDYTACQELAHAARAADVAWVQYRSVREPAHGLCGAVLNPRALSVGTLTDQLSWVSAVRGRRVSLSPMALGSPYHPFEFSFQR